MGKDAYYFSHDSNASRDPKIVQMRSVYKAEGYGWYWMLVEQMREQENYKLPLSGKYAVNAYALQMGANAERLNQFIADCVNEFHLFEQDAEFLWSTSLLRRMKKMDVKSEKARQSALERWGKSNVNNADAMRTHSERNANVMQRKEKKGNKKKGNSPTPPASPASAIFQYFGQHYQNITEKIADNINDAINEYSEEYVLDALKEGHEHHAHSWKYVEEILKSRKRGGRDNGYPENEPKVLTANEWFAAEKADREKRGLKNYDL